MNNPPLPSPTGSPIPMAVAPAGRGAGFWILIIGGCLGLCGVLLVAGLFLLGVAAGISEDAAPSNTPATGGSSAGPASKEPPGTGEPDDFLYHSTNGLHLIAPNRIVAEGVSVTLAGTWHDDHRNIVLRLHDGGRYELSAGGGAISGHSKYDLVASTSAEKGAWTFAGSTLTLTPDQVGSTGIAEGHQESGKGKTDPPRQWSVLGLTIEYLPHDSKVYKQRPGLRVTGPSPSWYYPSGDMKWDLRRGR